MIRIFLSFVSFVLLVPGSYVLGDNQRQNVLFIVVDDLNDWI